MRVGFIIGNSPLGDSVALLGLVFGWATPVQNHRTGLERRESPSSPIPLPRDRSNLESPFSSTDSAELARTIESPPQLIARDSTQAAGGMKRPAPDVEPP
jgi:hypothetical protein